MTALRLALVLSFARSVMSQRCYWPNGDDAVEYVACPGYNDTLTSWPCCHSGEWPHIDPCLSNGFCFSSDQGALYRGACTTRGGYNNMSDTNCVKECSGVYDQGTAWVSLCTNGELCCTVVDDPLRRDCCNGSTGDLFAWPDATFTGPLNASTLENVTDVRAAIPGADAAGETVTITPTAIASASDSDGGYSQGTLIGVGIGLGVPLIIALVSICWLLFMLKREREHKAEQGPKQEYASLAPGGPMMAQQNSNAFDDHSPYGGSRNGSSLPAYGYPQDMQKSYMSPQRMPSQGHQPVSELDHERTPAEVPGN
ncbi:hypothetical protein HII31_07882 [Pseudocercospora fuligena]|uniref:WSC domain-containing protein n=1 Tax=Pseudocercospora fuligena TaxID=685502 RepID=A0A8H6VFT0_9PEZI|nr:hypothetical protein HII31_07882 [Pseudocercospora fuligena]